MYAGSLSKSGRGALWSILRTGAGQGTRALSHPTRVSQRQNLIWYPGCVVDPGNYRGPHSRCQGSWPKRARRIYTCQSGRVQPLCRAIRMVGCPGNSVWVYYRIDTRVSQYHTCRPRSYEMKLQPSLPTGLDIQFQHLQSRIVVGRVGLKEWDSPHGSLYVISGTPVSLFPPLFRCQVKCRDAEPPILVETPSGLVFSFSLSLFTPHVWRCHLASSLHVT